MSMLEDGDGVQYFVGGAFAFAAATLRYLGEPISALIPATVAIYVLGSLLYAKLFRKS
jgi:hypothetical protein